MGIKLTEKEIENSIFEYLSYQKDVFAFKVNTMGVFDQTKGLYRKLSKNVIPGTPDIIVCVSVKGIGVFLALEVKSEKGTQSEDQVQFQKDLQRRADGFYFVVRSIKDAEDALRKVRAIL